MYFVHTQKIDAIAVETSFATQSTNLAEKRALSNFLITQIHEQLTASNM